MTKNAIGLIELSSVAAGYLVSDAMLKAARVDLLLSRTICSGKYLVLVAGEVAGVEAGVAAGLAAGGAFVIESCSIPNLDPAVFPAISGGVILREPGALGLIESFSVAALIEGADVAVKAAKVQLLEIRLAMALGGKAFARLVGDVAAVEAAVEAGAGHVARRGLLVNRVVIPAPAKELYGEVL
jgi:microcompartment protein CcmL/EutN